MNPKKWQPVIPVILISPEVTLRRQYFLVDSGADVTLLPKSLGEKLGFKNKRG